MNRGVLKSSTVQQMMTAGNPNWWNINRIRPPVVQQTSPFLAPPPNLFPPFAPAPPPTTTPSSSSWHDENNQEFPESLSQLLLGGLLGEEDKPSTMMHMQTTKLENWEEQLLIQTTNGAHVSGQKQGNVQFQREVKPNWTQMLPLSSSSPESCITNTLSRNNMLDFSNNKTDGRQPPADRSSERNRNGNDGVAKKARVQSSSTQSTFKVRKEKLGDRITALHQLVSPFGKTDTASVLLEAIGYIRFLQTQIGALSLPYLGSGSGNMSQQQQQSLTVQAGENNNSLFPDQEAGKLLYDQCLKRELGRTSDHQQFSPELEPNKDLRSRGLCLVPISSTQQVGNDNGADYWASALGGGFR